MAFVVRVTPGNGTVVALAGRRIDADGAPQQRFPLANVPWVVEQLQTALTELDACTLVCSAANGADLLALEIARQHGIRCRIVLPCSANEFRRASVSDRPGERWGLLFDELIASARSLGDLIVLEAATPETTDLHLAANARIIDEALQVAAGSVVTGVAVWDGRSRGADDVTAAFVQRLAEHHIPVRHIPTL